MICCVYRWQRCLGHTGWCHLRQVCKWHWNQPGFHTKRKLSQYVVEIILICLPTKHIRLCAYQKTKSFTIYRFGYHFPCSRKAVALLKFCKYDDRLALNVRIYVQLDTVITYISKQSEARAYQVIDQSQKPYVCNIPLKQMQNNSKT